MPKQYYDCMDPLVALATAAAVTKKIRLCTGICLIIQRDPIQLAKEVATLDQLSGGRVVLGVGAGWAGANWCWDCWPWPCCSCLWG